MRNLLLLLLLIIVFSCKSSIQQESQTTISYKATKPVFLENMSSNHYDAQFYLELKRGLKTSTPEERKASECYWQRKFDELKPKLTAAELIALAEYEKKLKADENFPYDVYTDSGTFSLKTSTVSKILGSGETVSCD